MSVNHNSKLDIFLNIVTPICAILVVILHQYNISGLDNTSSFIISFISHGVCTVSVPIFFFISGYLFWRNVDGWDSIKHKLYRRIETIFLPFIIWNCLYAIVLISLKNLWHELDLHEIISSVFLYKYYFPMWFMFQLIVYFALSPLLYLLAKFSSNTILILIGVLIALTLFYRNNISFQYNHMERAIIYFNFLIYFLGGMLMSRYKEIFLEYKLPNIYICLILFILSSILSALCYDGYIKLFYNRLFIPLVFLTFLVLMVKVVQIVDLSSKAKELQISLMRGVSPISIYFIHGLIGLFMINVLEYLSWGNSLTRYFFLSISTVLLSILVAKLLRRVVPSVYKVYYVAIEYSLITIIHHEFYERKFT